MRYRVMDSPHASLAEQHENLGYVLDLFRRFIGHDLNGRGPHGGVWESLGQGETLLPFLGWRSFWKIPKVSGWCAVKKSFKPAFTIILSSKSNEAAFSSFLLDSAHPKTISAGCLRSLRKRQRGMISKKTISLSPISNLCNYLKCGASTPLDDGE